MEMVIGGKMEKQAKYTKTANIIEMDNNVSVEFFDSENNYLRFAGDELKDVAENITKIFEKFKIPKSEEELKIEELEKENKEMLKIITEKTTLDERIDMASILPRWEVDKEYKKNDERVYNDILYIAKKDHKSTYETIPVNSLEFWKKAVKAKDIPGDYNHERKYKINEKCTFNRHIYVSLIEQEGQSPFASPETWKDKGEI